ncbi:hypothetical protein [Helicobacter sp. T3_23-1056]
MQVLSKNIMTFWQNLAKTSTKQSSKATQTKPASTPHATPAQKSTPAHKAELQGKGFVMQKNTQKPQKYEIHSTITPQTKELARLEKEQIRANLEILKNTHPEQFHTRGQVFRAIKQIKDNPTHFYQQGDIKRDMSIVGKFLENGKFGEIGIIKSGENAGKIGHILKSSAGNKRAHNLSKRERGEVVRSDNPSHTDILKNSSDGRAGKNLLLPSHKQNSTPKTSKNQALDSAKKTPFTRLLKKSDYPLVERSNSTQQTNTKSALPTTDGEKTRLKDNQSNFSTKSPQTQGEFLQEKTSFTRQ